MRRNLKVKIMIPLTSIPFRLFFLLASLIAVLNPTLWISNLFGNIDLAINVTPIFWHAHEMVFGFTAALLGGFLLTASANWTQTVPYRGAPLVFLVLVWLFERCIYFFSP